MSRSNSTDKDIANIFKFKQHIYVHVMKENIC